MSLKVYKSSAGSGKTYTLVKEYLTLALATDNPNRYKSIMAVTFTNKAANELKERVIKYLKIISGPANHHHAISQLVNDLQSLLAISETTLQNRALKTLKSILHSYSDFNISTIDKFILKIIRSFAMDFKIPLNFDIEMDSNSLLQQSIDNLLSEIGENKVLTDFLINYVNLQTDDDKGHDISKSLLKISTKLLTDDSLPYLEQIKGSGFQDFLQFKKDTSEAIKNYQDSIESKLKNGKELIELNSLKADDFKGKTRGSIFNFFHADINVISLQPTTSTVLKYAEQEDWSHADSSDISQSLLAKIKPELSSYITDIESIKHIYLRNILSISAIEKNIFEIALLNEIDKKLQALKKENNFIHISEFNQKVAEIVVQQPIPFIYERIGERYQNYLVDEFQDTSELQWQNLMPLIENALASQNLNLLVGDVKQAIYRFRGGNADQFQHLGNDQYVSANKIVSERLGHIRRYLKEKKLSSNYRSLPEIVNFNNEFFKELLPTLAFQFQDSYYQDYQQEIASTKKGGYVQIQSFPKEKTEDNLQNHLNYILSQIHQLVRNGRNFGEIAILCRTKSQINVIGEELTKNNIPILSSEGLSLGKNRDIVFIMNLIKLEYLPNEDKEIVGVCSYLFNSDDTILQEVINSKNRKEQLRSSCSIKTNKALPTIKHLNLYEAAEKIVNEMDLDRNSPFIQKLMEVLNDRQKENIQDFLNWWEEKKTKIFISSPESINAVNLMTIHKAKGLEFPVVFFPLANISTGNHQEQQWVDISHLKQHIPVALINLTKNIENSDLSPEYEKAKRLQLLDDLNVLYVALTRPVEELYISLVQTNSNKKPIDSVARFFDPLLSRIESDYFEFGSPIVKTKEILTELSTEKLPEFSGNWKSKVKLSYNAPIIWDVPATSEDPFISVNDPQTRGNLLHTIISQISPEDTVNDTINNNILNGTLSSKDASTITTIIENMISNPEFQQLWIEDHHISEKELITSSGNILRPDRIIVKKDKVVLLDFKSGEHSPSHRTQIKRYESALKDLFKLPIKPYLIYLEPAEIVPV